MQPPSQAAPASSPNFADAEEVLGEIQRIVRDELELSAEVTAQAHLLRDLGLDSLGLLTVAVGLENRFRVRLNEEDATWVTTAGDLARLVRLRIEEQRS